ASRDRRGHRTGAGRRGRPDGGGRDHARRGREGQRGPRRPAARARDPGAREAPPGTGGRGEGRSAALVQAAMEGVALALADGHAPLTASGTRIGDVTLTGGGARQLVGAVDRGGD